MAQRSEVGILQRSGDSKEPKQCKTKCERLERANWERVSAGDISGVSSGLIQCKRKNHIPTSRFCRGADGVPHRVDRLRALGNAVVPQASEWVGRRIMETIGKQSGK